MTDTSFCKKHNRERIVPGGCSAHPTNWYCPECDREKELDSLTTENTRLEAELAEAKIERNKLVCQNINLRFKNDDLINKAFRVIPIEDDDEGELWLDYGLEQEQRADQLHDNYEAAKLVIADKEHDYKMLETELDEERGWCKELKQERDQLQAQAEELSEALHTIL